MTITLVTHQFHSTESADADGADDAEVRQSQLIYIVIATRTTIGNTCSGSARRRPPGEVWIAQVARRQTAGHSKHIAIAERHNMDLIWSQGGKQAAWQTMLQATFIYCVIVKVYETYRPVTAHWHRG